MTLGSRVRSAFLSDLRWGAEAEWDESAGGYRWRLAALRILPDGAGAWEQAETFAGAQDEAEAFARRRGLRSEGLRAAFHHPFARIRPVPAESLEEAEAAAERALPAGLKPEEAQIRVFPHGGRFFSAATRQDPFQAFLDRLPSGLSALESLVPGALALLPFRVGEAREGAWAALYALGDETQILFFEDGGLTAAQSLPAGWRAQEGDLRRELRKVLRWHWEVYREGGPLRAVEIWREGADGAMARAVADLGFATAEARWAAPLDKIEPEWRLAAAMALGPSGAVPDFGPHGMAHAVSERARRKLAGEVAWRAGLVLGIAYALLAAGSAAVLGFDAWVASKSRQWAGPLAKREALMAARTRSEERLAELGPLAMQANHPGRGFAQVSDLLPDGVWLESWEGTAPPDSASRHLLTGYAVSEGRVPECVGALQKSGLFRSVRLRLTERIPGEKVAEKTGLAANRRDLIRFELVAEK